MHESITVPVPERVDQIMKVVRVLEESQRAAKAVGVGSTAGTGVHHLTREVFDALPTVGSVVEWRDGERRYWSKYITKDSTAYTDERPNERVREVMVKRQEAKYEHRMPGGAE